MFNQLYSKKVLKHFRNPQNMGEMKKPDGMATVGNRVCGDIMRLFIKVGERKPDGRGATLKKLKQTESTEKYIKDIKFQTLGCAAAISVSSILTTMVKGKPLKDVEKITNQTVIKALGGLPKTKIHCSVLVADALKKAIKNYRQKT